MHNYVDYVAVLIPVLAKTKELPPIHPSVSFSKIQSESSRVDAK